MKLKAGHVLLALLVALGTYVGSYFIFLQTPNGKKFLSFYTLTSPRAAGKPTPGMEQKAFAVLAKFFRPVMEAEAELKFWKLRFHATGKWISEDSTVTVRTTWVGEIIVSSDDPRIPLGTRTLKGVWRRGYTQVELHVGHDQFPGGEIDEIIWRARDKHEAFLRVARSKNTIYHTMRLTTAGE